MHNPDSSNSSKTATTASGTTVSGLAERLSLAGSDVGIGVTNLLADLGPASTQSASTLRDTLREITKTFPSFGSTSVLGMGLSTKTVVLSEEAVARLIFFFSERGSRKQNKDNSDSSTLVGTLTNDFEIGEGSEWKLSNVAEVLKEDYASLNWTSVAQKFDFPEFFIRDAVHLTAFVNLFRASSNIVFPFSVIVGSAWKNSLGQLSLVENILEVPPIVFDIPLSDSESSDAATAASSTSNGNPKGWASVITLQCLLHFSETTSLFPRVRDLFVKGLLSYPEVLLCSLVHTQLAIGNAQLHSWPSSSAGMQLKGQVMRELIPLFFKPNAKYRVQNGPAAIRRLWAISPGTVEAACIESWRSTANETAQARFKTLSHIIGIIRILPSAESATVIILNSNKDIEFTIALAYALSDLNMLNLRSWLNERVISGGFFFFMSLSTFLNTFQRLAMPRPLTVNENEGLIITTENLSVTLIFLSSLEKAILDREIPGSINKQTVGDLVKGMKDSILTSHPSISMFENEEDIEEAANSYFQKIYSSEQTIDEVVEMLKRFKVSGTARENDIFTCMIHNLFDEYRFFSKYPEKELRITGILFGKLIQHQLVTSITLGIALRYVLEALRKPPGPPGNTTSNQGKMFRFGMFALEQFKERLHEWPQYCSHIVMIPYLKEGYADLVKEIEICAAPDNAIKPIPVQPGSSSLTNSDSMSTSSDRSIQKAAVEISVPSSVDVRASVTTPIESVKGVVVSSTPVISLGGQSSSFSSTLATTPVKSDPIPQKIAIFGPGLGRAVNASNEDYQHEEPPSAILDRVQFLINNVTMSNVEPKAQELKDMLDSRHFGWLGNYLVVKRISTQPNYHSVYLSFLDQLGDYGKGLVDAILTSVYHNVGKLLRSPKITVSTSERSLLKNLGSFLGHITLARNKPVLQIMLDCKELLFQGYETGMLIAVTPFVAKILEGSKNSMVFKPPNPWVMGLLSVFRALYGVEDLKMNIKFEVEVLCKNLGIKLEDIPIRSDELSKRLPPNKLKNPDFNIKSSSGTSSSTNLPTASITSVVSTPDAKQPLPTADISPINTTSLTAVSSSNIIQTPSATLSQSSQDQQNTVIPNLSSYVTVNPSLIQLFQKFPLGHSMMNVTNVTLKKAVPTSVDRAIREIIQPVVERSVTIACITTKEIINKDFAMESDENKMRSAAHLMVSNLAGSLALVTCKEPLRASISSHLRQLLVSTINGNQASSVQLSDQEQSIVDQCVAMCATDNLELGCMLIEKAAMEKAIRDVDETLNSAFTKRMKHREQTGQPYYDVSLFASGNQKYPAALPEPLRPKPGWLRNEHFSIYEAFQRVIRPPALPSTQSTTSSDRISPGVSSTGVSSNESTLSRNSKLNMDALASLVVKLDSAVTSCLSSVGPRAPEISFSMLPSDHEIKQILSAAKQLTSSVIGPGSITAGETESLLGFAQSIFKRLYELRLSEPLRIECFISILEIINDCCRQLGQDLGTWATYAPTETDSQRKLHRTILLLLVRSRLVLVSEIDDYLYKSVDGGRNMTWVEFSSLFLRTAILENIAQPKDLPKTMNVLIKVGGPSMPNNPASQLLRLLEEMVSAGAEAKGRVTPENISASFGGISSIQSIHDRPTFQQSSSISATSLANFVVATKRAEESIDTLSKNDPMSLQQQVMILLDGWMRIINDLYAHEKSVQYIQLLHQNGVGKNEEQTERFFRSSAELLVEAVLKSASIDVTAVKDSKQSYTKVLNYAVIDAFGKLICLMIRQVGNGARNDQVSQQQISLLNQVLGIIIRTMMANYERFKKENGGAPLNWDQRPWFRLLLNLLMDLNAPSPALDPINFGIVSVFGAAFHIVQPLVVPGFAFAWLELVSHRMFLTNLLMAKGQKGWALAHQLLIDLLLFLEPHLRKIEMTEAIKSLYKGTLRVLLVLLHDFPAFLAGYHLSFCNVIPENCIQVRNLILSAFPRGMVLPDPFTPNLKIDLLPEIAKSPVILSNVAAPLVTLRSDIESYLKNRQPVDFVHGLLPRLCKEGTKEIDALKVNALVLFIAIQAISRLQSSQFSHSLAHSPEMEILQKLMDLNDRGRYICLNAIANQLRYPSSHTHYFSCVMLFLFSESRDEAVREQITRVLLERLIVHRPHPWGLLITFIELIKNQRYQFWSHPFTHCASEIEKVFESVARSCMTPGVRTGAGEPSQ